MRYLIRTLKYYVYYCIIIALVVFIMIKAGYAEPNLDELFVNGKDSLWQLALIIALFAAVYPRIGFSRKTIHIGSDLSAVRYQIISVADRLGYKLQEESASSLSFVRRSPFSRALKMWEDKISLSPTNGGIEIEGITKDIVRIKSMLEAQNNEQL